MNEAFFESSIIQPAKKGRIKAIGLLDGEAVAVIFKPLGSEAFSLISLRPASKTERRLV